MTDIELLRGYKRLEHDICRVGSSDYTLSVILRYIDRRVQRPGASATITTVSSVLFRNLNALVSLVGDFKLALRLESVDRAEFLPAPRQVVRLLRLNRCNVVLHVQVALLAIPIHYGVMAVVIAQRDRRLFHLLALKIAEKACLGVFLGSQILLVVSPDFLDCFDRDHVLVIDAHAFKDFDVELQFRILPDSFLIQLLLRPLLRLLHERQLVQVQHRARLPRRRVQHLVAVAEGRARVR